MNERLRFLQKAGLQDQSLDLVRVALDLGRIVRKPDVLDERAALQGHSILEGGPWFKVLPSERKKALAVAKAHEKLLRLQIENGGASVQKLIAQGEVRIVGGLQAAWAGMARTMSRRRNRDRRFMTMGCMERGAGTRWNGGRFWSSPR